MKNSSAYFQNRECEYFPCHKTTDAEDFNCLFCYCPLYRMEECGGNYRMTETGVKDCSGCLFPHRAANYPCVLKKIAEESVAQASRK